MTIVCRVWYDFGKQMLWHYLVTSLVFLISWKGRDQLSHSHRGLNSKRNGIFPYLLLLPCLVLFGCFVFYPFIRTIYLTFFVTNVNGLPVKAAGFSMWERVFKNKQYMDSVWLSFKFAAMVGVPTFFLAFVLAAIASEKSRGSRVYEVLFSLPMAIASAPAAAIFVSVLKLNGVLNAILGSSVNWLDDTKYAIICVAAITVWIRIGSSFIFLLTGFRNVPGELLESARVDGAGYLRRMFSVTIPVASPQIFFVVFLNITGSFQSFGQIKLLTGGGPANTTSVLIYRVYEAAFRNARFETACILSLLLFLSIFLITRIQFILEKKLVVYS